jgi:hypothetical protein
MRCRQFYFCIGRKYAFPLAFGAVKQVLYFLFQFGFGIAVIPELEVLLAFQRLWEGYFLKKGVSTSVGRLIF